MSSDSPLGLPIYEAELRPVLSHLPISPNVASIIDSLLTTYLNSMLSFALSPLCNFS